MPDSGIVCRLWGALSVHVSVPVSLPNTVGVKMTLTLHFWPTASVLGHVVEDTAKLPLAVMLPMSSVTEPVLSGQLHIHGGQDRLTLQAIIAPAKFPANTENCSWTSRLFAYVFVEVRNESLLPQLVGVHCGCDTADGQSHIVGDQTVGHAANTNVHRATAF